MPVDPSIALQVRPVQFENPLDSQSKALTLRHLMGAQQMQDMQLQQGRRQQQQDDEYAEALRAGVGADGKLDYGATLGALARSGNAKGYGALMKQQAEATKAGADLNHTNAQTADLEVKTKANRMAYVTESVKRMLSNPNLTTDDVIKELAQSPPEMQQQASQLVRNLSPDPRQLRQQLLTLGLNAEQQLKALQPQLQAIDTGSSQQLVDMNPMTRGAAPTSFKKTPTPGEAARLAWDREQGANQFIPVDGVGLYVGDKRTGSARQVTDPSGKPVVPNKALTEGQAKANLFGTRMQEADRIINSLAAKGVTAPSLPQQLTGGNGVTGSIATAAANPQQQQVDQAQRDFINAVLRRESGAAISPGEYDSARKQYFVQPGDSPEVIKQKARNRSLATQGMLAEVPDGRRGVPGMPAVEDDVTATGIPPEIAAIIKKHGGK